MRKRAEPKQLQAHRRDKSRVPTWENRDAATAQAIREALLKEQGHLCAYCVRRIGPTTANGMRVDHRIPQDADQSLILAWENLFGVCDGLSNHVPPDAFGTLGPSHHCDRSKGNSKIQISPTDVSCIRTLKYAEGSGLIISSDDRFKNELDEILRLNCPVLIRARKSFLAGLIQGLNRKFGSGEWLADAIEKEVSLWSHATTDGTLREHCWIAEQFLSNRRTRALKRTPKPRKVAAKIRRTK